MNRLTLVAIALACSARAALAQPPAPIPRLCMPSPAAGTSPTGTPESKIAQLAWLGGTWIGTTGTSRVEEHWTPPAGGVMLATARTLRGGIQHAFEFLCIVERNGTLVYQAMPNGRQPPTDFTLATVTEDSATFENPSNDFPKAVRYTLASDGTLEVVISGTPGQKPQAFRFRRQ